MCPCGPQPATQRSGTSPRCLRSGALRRSASDGAWRALLPDISESIARSAHRAHNMHPCGPPTAMTWIRNPSPQERRHALQRRLPWRWWWRWRSRRRGMLCGRDHGVDGGWICPANRGPSDWRAYCWRSGTNSVVATFPPPSPTQPLSLMPSCTLPELLPFHICLPLCDSYLELIFACISIASTRSPLDSTASHFSVQGC